MCLFSIIRCVSWDKWDSEGKTGVIGRLERLERLERWFCFQGLYAIVSFLEKAEPIQSSNV